MDMYFKRLFENYFLPKDYSVEHIYFIHICKDMTISTSDICKCRCSWYDLYMENIVYFFFNEVQYSFIQET